jgi:G3E family GTPase
MITRLIIVGGFLGAGKTTLMLKAAQQLTARGYRVGLVTNDQGADLVDTALLSQQHFPVTEVSGSCFCCAFPDLLQALRQLHEQAQPDVVLAEPVGSCTDLVSTVLRPLQSYYPTQFDLAPLSVLADVTRDPNQFSETISYLFDRQLTEAEIILLNKIDLLDNSVYTEQLKRLQERYPRKQLLSLSARSGEGIREWLDLVLGQDSRSSENLDVDYERYAQAESELGWLNVKGTVRSSVPFSARQWLLDLLNTLAQSLGGFPIAHIKTYVATSQAAFKASITRNGMPLILDVDTVDVPTDALNFTLNARIHVDPQTLQARVLEVIEAVKPHPLSRYHLTHFECFRPLPPRPSHRLAVSLPQ